MYRTDHVYPVCTYICPSKVQCSLLKSIDLMNREKAFPQQIFGKHFAVVRGPVASAGRYVLFQGTSLLCSCVCVPVVIHFIHQNTKEGCHLHSPTALTLDKEPPVSFLQEAPKQVSSPAPKRSLSVFTLSELPELQNRFS